MNLNRNALLQKAATHFRKGDLFAARMVCQQILSVHHNDIGALEILARVEFDDGNLDLALLYQRALVAAQPKNLHFRLILGTMYTRMGRYDEAIAELNKACLENPGDTDAWYAFALALSRSGDHAQAEAVIEQAAVSGKGHAGLTVLNAEVATARGRPQDAVKLLLNLAPQAELSRSALFVLGKAYEKLGDADHAIAAYSAAKSKDRPPFDRNRLVTYIDAIIETCSPDRLKRLPRAQHDSELPVFVAALPRSGTTLLTRIIGSHPDAADGGENGILARIMRDINLTIGSTLVFPEVICDLDQSDAYTLGQMYLDATRKISSEAQRVADKSMSNHLYLGVIRAILPRSRVIWCKRNPVDTCLACFSEDFGTNIAFTHSLADLGLAYAQFDRLMRHWQAVLELPIVEVRYESLVKNPVSETRRIIEEACGLPWDDRCLRYYEAPSTPSAGLPTLSLDQVRKPIYTTSVGRAKKFEKHLGPLLQELGPLADAP